MTKKKKHQIGLGVILFFVLFCLIGGAIGILVNNEYYANEKGRVNAPHSQQFRP